jgi:hypothetical protein
MKREPALLVTLLVLLLRWALSALDVPALDDEALRAVADVLLAVGGALVIRARVFSEHTLREAGLTPTEVEARAENPQVQRAGP